MYYPWTQVHKISNSNKNKQTKTMTGGGSSSDVTEKVRNGKVPTIVKPNDIKRKETDGGISYSTNISKLSGTSDMGDTNISYEPESFRTNPSPEKKTKDDTKDKNSDNTQTVVIDVRTSKVDD